MTTRPTRAALPRCAGDAGWMPATVLGVIAGVVLVIVLVFVGYGALLDEGTDDDVPLAVEDVDEGGITAAAYEAIELGMTKDAVQVALEPALPVDSAILDEYELTSPEQVAAECVYYDTEGFDEKLYRFCFVADELVEKTFVLPREDEPVTEDDPVG